MTLANKITILRIIFIPIYIIALLGNRHFLALGLFTASMLTDFLDGFAARIRKQKTPLGSLLDPFADKFLLISSFITLTYLGKIPIWVTIVVFSKDLIIVLGWVVVYILTNRKTISPRWSGKIATFLQMLVIFVSLVGFGQIVINLSLYSMIFFTVISGIDYILVGNRNLNQLEVH